MESATFSLYNLRKTQMAHGIFTEAITRFTKGQPPYQTLEVAEECAEKVLFISKNGTTHNARLTKVNNDKRQRYEVYDVDGLSCNLTTNSGGLGGKTGLYKVAENNFTKVNDTQSITTTNNGNTFSVQTKSRCHPLTKKQENYVLEMNNSNDTQSFLKIRESTKKGYKEAHIGDGVLLNRSKCKTAKGIVQKERTGSLKTDGVGGTVTSDYLIRRLTPVECERLQGFPMP